MWQVICAARPYCSLLFHALGKAVQVEPMKSISKAPGAKRLKLKYDKPLSNIGFDFNLRHSSSDPRS
jgi:hypothetical protein